MRDIACRLADKIIEMYTDAGEWVPSWGGPSGNPRQTYTDSLVLDAEDFMALDPQKINDEYFRIQRAARDTGEDGEAKGYLEVAGARLAANWHGAAATAFALQMSHIDTFMTQQQDRLLLAVQSMGALYKLVIDVRDSYYELADATIAACDLEMGKQATREAKGEIVIGAEIASAAVQLFSASNLRDLLTAGVEKFISISKESANIYLEGSEAGEVVNNYIRERDELRRSWESGLIVIRDWISNQESQLAGDSIPLLEPLPPNVDIDSPDFSYEHFANTNYSVDIFSPKVKQKREEMAFEEEPSGIIADRLDPA
ncbi:hypothetical protein [Actinokineospora sp. UTMC 2448]|uniref:hypothetical protein n=1 Tax=Actinokineospora sp. UTMC 2448 TaxID=2268449 RepID=UPI0021648E74|nr:hypothetical protein [Actinokineospora sp. UTMC 2448]